MTPPRFRRRSMPAVAAAHPRRRCPRVLCVCFAAGWATVTAASGVYKTQKEALAEAFPGGVERKTIFLTDEQVKEIEQRARAKLDSKVVTYYLGRTVEGQPAGAAFFDTHVVRTTTETVFVWLSPEGRVERVEILAFYEPEDYKVRDTWLATIEGKALDDDVTVGRDLVRVTGATLSVRALAASVRRAMALQTVVMEETKS